MGGAMEMVAVVAEIRWEGEGEEEVRGDRFGVGRRPLR